MLLKYLNCGSEIETMQNVFNSECCSLLNYVLVMSNILNHHESKRLHEK